MSDNASLPQAEELNRFKEEDKGRHWGYPWCWTEFKVPEPYGEGLGTIWAWPSFLEDGEITDAQCRSDEYVPPVMALQGHSAPLGITFYEWKAPEERPATCPPHAAFPESMDGYAFIAYHGSWNRDVPTGYKVVYVAMDKDGNPSGTQPVDLLARGGDQAKWSNGFRPVDVDFDDCGRLLISSDGSRPNYSAGSKIVRMENSALPDFNHTAYEGELMEAVVARSGAEAATKLSSGGQSAWSSLALVLVLLGSSFNIFW